MRRYEVVVILDPEMGDDDIQAFTDRHGNLIKSQDGEVIKIEDWGYKKLAYLVKKKDRGRYILFDFVGMPALIAELERQFKISERVMKYLSVKVDDDVDLAAFRAQAQEKQREQEAAAQAAAQAAADAAAEAARSAEAQAAEAQAAEAQAAEAQTGEAQEEAPAETETSEADTGTETPAEEPAAASTDAESANTEEK